MFLAVGLLISASLHAEESYHSNLERDLKRGFKNIVSAPLEIPIGIQKAHESAGYPVVRHVEGVFCGALKTVQRFGSGVWDWIIAWIPGKQEGLPPNPATLF